MDKTLVAMVSYGDRAPKLHPRVDKVVHPFDPLETRLQVIRRTHDWAQQQGYKYLVIIPDDIQDWRMPDPFVDDGLTPVPVSLALVVGALTGHMERDSSINVAGISPRKPVLPYP